MKVLLFLISFLFFFIAAGVFIYQFIFIPRQKGALQVTSFPESRVYLNGEYIGNTPLCRCGDIEGQAGRIGPQLTTGDYTIKLVPISGGFPAFQESITIMKSVLTVVDRKFAKGASSDGVVMFLSPLSNKQQTELAIQSVPEDAEIILDGNKLGTSPLTKKDISPSDHSLTLQKEGYKTKTTRIRITPGYRLSVKTFLGIDPLFFSAPEEVASASTSLVAEMKKVTILETGTGFLRVRKGPSITEPELTRIKPGEEYEFVDEQQGWIQIKLPDGQLGWISSQYAKKN